MSLTTRINGLKWQCSGDFLGDGGSSQIAPVLSGVTPSGYIPVIERAAVMDVNGGSPVGVDGATGFGLSFNDDEHVMMFNPPGAWLRNIHLNSSMII